MNDFTFDSETHTYRLDGEILPGVTSIISNGLHPYAGVTRELLERAAEFGTNMHMMVKLYLADDLDEESLDPALAGCLQGFRLFLLERPEFASPPIVERPTYHPRLKYAGTPDLEWEWAVIDLKSRPVKLLTDRLQLSGYDNFGKGNRDRYVLELKQDGTYQLTQVDRTMAQKRESWSRFRYLLDYYNMGKTIERWK